MLSCTRRRPIQRLLRALHVFESLATAGSLPDCWRWVLGSRLVFASKKHGPVPRPIRVGELWKRVSATHSLNRNIATARRAMLRVHQYGVAVPGGTDTLIHARAVLEQAIRADPANGVWAVIDVDFANAFPTLEKQAIEAAIAEFVPELSAWTRWCHGAGPADVVLPSGDVHHSRRGLAGATALSSAGRPWPS